MAWNNDKEKMLAELYNDHKAEMWKCVAAGLGEDVNAWRQVENKAWELGEKRMVKRGWA